MHSLAISTYSTAAALAWLTTGCGQVTSDLGVTHAGPNSGDASVADSGSEPPRPRCHPDAGSAPSVFEQTHYFIGEESAGPNYLPCGIYTFVYEGPTTRTDPGIARVLFERAGTVLFTVEYDWRTPVPHLDGPPFRLDFDGYFTLLIHNINTGLTDLWDLQYYFDGKHVLVDGI
jgi:hypothetical protein